MDIARRGAYRRTAFFVLALAALLAVARPGMPSFVVVGVFFLYVAIAAVWIAGQYAQSLGGRQEVVPAWLWGLGLLAAAGLITLWFVKHWSGTLLGGLFLIYLLAGSAVAAWRQRPGLPRRLGLGLTVIAVLLTVAGSALLWLTSWRLAAGIVLALGVLLFLPLALTIGAEQTINTVRTPYALILGFLGLLLLGATGYLGVRISHSSLVLWVLGAIAVLVVAMASATQADVVLIMSLIAAMGVTPRPAGEPGHLEVQGRQRVLVALGDSFMSGEGASIYYEGTDEADPDRGDQCRRSPTAWAVLAARSPAFDGLDFLACSGARTWNVLPQPPADPPADVTLTRKGVPAAVPDRSAQTQLQQYQQQKGFTPAMVVLSVGGNDAGFSTIGQMCLAPGSCDEKADLWTTSLAQVERNLRATYVAVDDSFPGVPVAIVPYPDPIQLTRGCNQLALSRREKEFLHDYVGQLNGVITRTAGEFGFHVVDDMQRALGSEHLQLCDPRNDGRPGLNFVGLRSVRGGAEERYNPRNWSHSSLHPNERGHAAMSRTFQGWLARQPSPLPPRVAISALARDRQQAALTAQSSKTLTQAAQEARAEAPLCQLGYGDDQGTCRPQGTDWTLKQIGHLLLARWGLLAFFATVLGAWLVAVGFFTWRRRSTEDSP
ncbi:GDSL-type esterase/lipase family protein [Actinoplanes sp. NPDC051470]|uniref:GDSL-type esterase/lipase family protein n=1 Tax=Actinoplanes sp. NPDC051470 TaxID=3157224 RepID=UPI003420B0B0